jgi:hypothetical protein
MYPKDTLQKVLNQHTFLTNLKFLFFQLFLIKKHYYWYYAFERLPTFLPSKQFLQKESFKS